MKGRSQPDFIEQLSIPLPPDLDTQTALVAEIERQQAIITGAELVTDNWQVDLSPDCADVESKSIGSLLTESLYGTSEKADYGDEGLPVLRIGNIKFCQFDLSDLKRSRLPEDEAKRYLLQPGDFLIVRSNGNPDLVGKCAVWDGPADQYIYASYLIRFRFDTTQVDPRFAMFYLMSPQGRALLKPEAGGGTYNLSATAFQAVKIPLPPSTVQRSVVARLKSQVATVNAVTALAQTAATASATILHKLWNA